MTGRQDVDLTGGQAAGTGPGVSVVIPARDEAPRIGPVLDAILNSVPAPREILVVVDDGADPTVSAVAATAARRAIGPAELRCLVSAGPAGPAGAIRSGLAAARAPVAVVTMADGSDDPGQIGELAGLVRGGFVVAAASRYCRGGRQDGGPAVKGLLSRLAGRSLRLLAGTGTSDATNSFKAYSTAFVREVGVDTSRGFAVGIELTAKATRLGLPVTEIPTTWRGRRSGRSAFRLAAWLPEYLRWYLFAFGGRPARVGGRS